jgi:hypothetical protein
MSINNKRGSALTIILILMSTMLPLIAFISDRMIQVDRYDSFLRKKAEFDQLTNSIVVRLSQSQLCKDSISGQLFGNMNMATTGDTSIKMFEVNTGQSVVMLESGLIVNGLEITAFRTENFIYNGLQGTPSSPTYSGDIYLAVKNNTGVGDDEFKQTFKVSVVSNVLPPNSTTLPSSFPVIACNNTQALSTVAEDVCQSVGGTYDPAADPRCFFNAPAPATPIALDVENLVAEHICLKSGGNYNISGQGKCTFSGVGVSAQIDAVINVDGSGNFVHTKKEVQGLSSAFIKSIVKSKFAP